MNKQALDLVAETEISRLRMELRRYRNLHEKTWAQVAIECGISPRTFYSMFEGRELRGLNLIKISMCLGIPIGFKEVGEQS